MNDIDQALDKLQRLIDSRAYKPPQISIRYYSASGEHKDELQQIIDGQELEPKVEHTSVRSYPQTEGQIEEYEEELRREDFVDERRRMEFGSWLIVLSIVVIGIAWLLLA